MSLPISEELLKDMSVMVVNYKKICEHFKLTEQQMLSANAGDWIIDFMRQYETAFLVNKAITLNRQKNTSVEGYHEPVKMPPIPPIPTIEEGKEKTS